MIEILVFAVLLVIILGIAVWCVQMLPIAAPFKNAAQVLIALIGIIVLLSLLFGWMPLPGHLIRR